MAGSYSDKYGRKKFLMIFNILCAMFNFIFFITNNPIIYIANFIQMLSGFVLMTVKNAYFSELFNFSFAIPLFRKAFP